ncbi:sulfite exporter TauE/SafE family protein, partial [Aquisalimonas sp.]|uniref:sulfite exporter TauE/SafE family protein n=1 Tax=Aquisalimonas sp. TaxID=1872621 RepID=UPI0025BE7A99
MHLAVGTSLAIIVPTSLRSARSHDHAGTVDTGLLRDLGLSLLAGVLLGVALSAMVSGRLLTAVFGIMAVLVAINMARTGGPPRITGTPPRGALRHGIGAFIGSVSTMMGIGGGTLSVPTLDALGYPIRRSIGNGCRHWYHHFGAGRGWFHHVIHYVQADYLRGVRQSPRRFLQAPRGNFRGCHQYPPWRWWFTGRSAYGFDPSGRCR